MIVGAITEGGPSWTTPFCWMVGVFAQSLFALLAAVYLTVEADTPALADDFRARALIAGAGVAALALVVPDIEPGRARGLDQDGLGAAAAPGHGRVGHERFRSAVPARLPIGTHRCGRASLPIVWGWALAQYPFLIRPGVTIQSAATPAATLRLLLTFLVVGALVLFPALAVPLRRVRSRDPRRERKRRTRARPRRPFVRGQRRGRASPVCAAWPTAIGKSSCAPCARSR